MKPFFPFFLFLLTSCSKLTVDSAPRPGKSTYSFTDVSGTYSFQRETKTVKRRLVTRAQLNDPKTFKTVEKSVTVSQMGTVKDKKSRSFTLRPLASEFTVWLDGKKYSSRMHLNARKKTMTVKSDGPETKWRGTSEVAFPKSQYFCFHSQIPDCLYHNKFLQKAVKRPNESFPFYVVWDSFPFMQEQFSGIGKNLFVKAGLKYEGEVKKTLRFVVELENQVILYHFSKSYDLIKMAWIAQGITVVPPGEEIPNENE